MDTFTLTAGDATVSVTLPPASDYLIDPNDAELRKRQDTNFTFEVVSPDGTRFSADASAKKSRSDTNFKFELAGVLAGPASDAASELATFDLVEHADGSIPQDRAFAAAGKKRQDTSLNFEITTQDNPAGGSAEAFAKKTRTDTSFKFEVVASDGVTGSTELLGGRTRKDTSFKFEVLASDPGSAPTEALAASKRKSSNFDFERTATPTDGGLMIAEMQESLSGSSLVSETSDKTKKPRHDTAFSVAVVTPGGVFASVVVRSSESAVPGE